jgi:hypothetical protein
MRAGIRLLALPGFAWSQRHRQLQRTIEEFRERKLRVAPLTCASLVSIQQNALAPLSAAPRKQRAVVRPPVSPTAPR